MSKKQPTTIICDRCGSLDVTADACARWNDDAQDWETVTVYDNTDCQSCGGECHTDERPVGFDPFSEGFDMDRIEMVTDYKTKTITLMHYPADAVRWQGVNVGAIGPEVSDIERDGRARTLCNSFAGTLVGCVSIIEREAAHV